MKEKVRLGKICTRKKNGAVPILVKFQNGQLSAFTKENTDFCCFRNREDESQLGALLVANGQKYHGLINDTDASKMTDMYIGIRNKVTNEMTVVPIDQVTLKNSIYQDIDKMKRPSLSAKVNEMTLLKKFSSRKASRYIHEKEKMRMDIKIVEEELKTTVDEANVEDNPTVENNGNTYFDKIRPKINLKAENVSEVYKIEDVVPNTLLNRLDQEAKTVYQTDTEHLPIESLYLKNLITSIQQSPADHKSLLRLKVIIYMDCLLRLIKSRAKSLKKVELSEISEKVENDVRDRFSDPNASFPGCRTAFSIEKALCHFIVLSLLVEGNYKVNVVTLSEELNASRAKILKYAHIVQVLPTWKSSVLSLKLPKDVPPLPTKFLRKK